MTREIYSLILNSENATNAININNQTQMQYYINWESVLPYTPNKKQTYKLSFSLRTAPNISALPNSGFVEILMGQTNSNEQNGTSNIIGVISPYTVHQSHYLIATPNDNMPVQVEYPSSSLITVNFLDFDKVTPFNMIHYVLILTFEAVDE
jgi:hypothetical protein